MHLDIIGVPVNAGCDREGVETAPKIIIDSGITDLLCNHNIANIDILPVSQVEVPDSSGSDMKHVADILDTTSLLADRVYDSLSLGRMPVMIGGDHSMTWGSLCGVSRALDDFACVYVDAHGDFNTAETSVTHNVHGMHMAYCMGFGDSRYVDFYKVGRKIDHRKVFWIGTRSLDEGEVRLSEQCDFNISTTKDVRRIGAYEVTSDILHRIDTLGIKDIHLSIDVDVLDPKVAPGTGVKEHDGLFWEELSVVLNTVMRSGKVRSVDLVEYNPLLDIDRKTLDICRSILCCIN